MSKRQRLIILILAIGDVVVLLLLGAAILFGSAGRLARQAAPSTATLPSSAPTATLPPTWTPSPTPTPYAYTPPTPTPRPPTSEEMAVLDQVEQQVAALRGLMLLRPVPRWVLNQTQLQRRIADWYGREEEQQAIRRAAVTLTAFDWLNPGTDLQRLWQGLLIEQVAGLYDAQAEAIFLVSNAEVSSPVKQMVFVHELDHALQDQHFDLGRMGLSLVDWAAPVPDDRQLALQALVEGDAALLQEQYIDQVFSEAELLAFQQEVASARHPRLDAAPRAVRELLLFPYTYGREFAATLYEQGKWTAIDAAYAAPPTSTEQILHPERYLAGDAPLPVPPPELPAILGGDWQPAFEGTAGEFWLRLYLENQLEPSRVLTATTGWGGDACAVYFNEQTGETAMALHTVWESIDEGEEFWEAVLDYAEARFGHPADKPGLASACWEGADALCVIWRDEDVILAVGPDLTMVEEIVNAAVEE